MKILKYDSFKKLNENIQDTPEEYVKSALMKIKSKIENMFGEQNSQQDIDSFDNKNDKDNSQSFKDLNLELQSCELSRYSKTLDNVKVIYQDSQWRYDLTISIDLKDAVPKEEDKDFSDNKIKECNIGFKVYDTENFNLFGKLSKTVKISEINQDLLVKLKIEIDDEFGSGKNDFEIETE